MTSTQSHIKNELAKTRQASFERALASVAKLVTPGVAGFHTHFEIIEIFEFSNAGRRATNVFTIMIAEEHEETVDEEPQFLCKQIRLPQFKHSFFGVQRSVKPIATILPRPNEIIEGVWRSFGGTIHLNEMAAATPAFVPSDSSTEVSWNRSGVIRHAKLIP